MTKVLDDTILCPLCEKGCLLRTDQTGFSSSFSGGRCSLGEEFAKELLKDFPFRTMVSVQEGELPRLIASTIEPMDKRLQNILQKKVSHLSLSAPVFAKKDLLDQILNTEHSLKSLHTIYRLPPIQAGPWLTQKDFYHTSPFGVAICAHRGDSDRSPENTLDAFQKAVDFGVDFVELDVHLTKDKEVIVFHDTYLDRTTNGKGRLHDYTYEELARLSAGEWFAPEFKEEKIPLLEEVLKILIPHTIPIIEIKHPLEINQGIWEKILSILKSMDIIEKVFISTRSLSFGLNLKESTPGIRVLHLSITKKQILEACSTILEGSTPYWRMVNEEVIDFAHKRGKWILPWTVDKPGAMKKLACWGVDGIITNKLPTLFKVLMECQKIDQWNPFWRIGNVEIEEKQKK
ncbi:MAG: hypothetical protein D6785_15135 [Planctomycetota bacterium]|nr:MAG: hypothetical protein D6785_15135 [Planctomycetota bacterium]